MPALRPADGLVEETAVGIQKLPFAVPTELRKRREAQIKSGGEDGSTGSWAAWPGPFSRGLRAIKSVADRDGRAGKGDITSPWSFRRLEGEIRGQSVFADGRNDGPERV